MKKNYILEHPQLSNKYTFLVDDVTDSGNWGMATDIDKIEYNRQLLEEQINIDIEIRKAFSQDGVTFVFNFGRFIIVCAISKHEKKGRMTFFDYQTDFSEI